MTFIPPISPKINTQCVHSVANALSRAEQNLEILTKVINQNGIPPFRVFIENGKKVLKLNPEIAKYAKVLGLTV